ncbi:DUF3149 domain-containing protein [Thiothrix unzii]|jgi:hypothetical protein|uniref:DUF3149 domain-containing protein n=2 Tax=Thiothrix TaxID=1030 RepID=A0A975FAA9_9GAMM|nr:DUF3149 domain-containing protein [Thiothrix unzii]MDX9988992.1 DUF3149 domain-containing protein [Thiothrix unzii]OQX12761.1 MAG: hypothetical protein BWK73_14090 [Thiothrix lacustris]QTR54296.1 DUF3149 domain-containing protein [Thiothrix unzii]
MAELLFGSWMGILSLLVIVITFVIVSYFAWLFVKKSGEN